MVLCCWKCGKEIFEEANFCSYRGRSIKAVPRKTGFTVAGGILAISAACASIYVGVVGIVNFASMLARDYYPSYPRDALLLIGIFGLIGFAFGLTGGILSLRRRRFAGAMFGISLIMISSLVDIVASAPYTITIIGQWFGTPKLILSTLSLILIAISKEDFT